MSRLRAIAAHTGLPLVLHGASGTGDGDLLEAVAAGVAKVNFNTEIRRAHVKALAQGLAVDGDDIRRIQQRSIDAMAAVAYEKIMLLSGRPNVEDGPTAGGEGSETG
jgi:fructose/tagatose bisphosphate aldolase